MVDTLDGVVAHEEETRRDLAGLDALELVAGPTLPLTRRVWAATWPKLAATALFLGAWQVLVWTGWKPEYVIPSPATVIERLWQGVVDGEIVPAVATTLQRGLFGYAISVVVGMAIGLAVARVRVLRVAVGSMITGLQTMPSIAWFPLAVLVFQVGEGAILFVVVIGAAPSIANGLISGIDNIPPILLRAGRVLGARGLSLYRHVVLPAAMPGFVSGLKQGWAFAWRSLLAGELIVLMGRSALGQQLTRAREQVDAPWMLSVMMAIFIVGVLMDSVLFGTLERRIRRRWGLEGG